MSEEAREIASIVAAGGETGALLRAADWRVSALGAPATWPQSLRSALGICLASPFPTCLLWGRDYVLLYNDAWIRIAGAGHPSALGRSAAEIWPERWHAIKPALDAMIAKTGGSWIEEDNCAMPWRVNAEPPAFRCAAVPVRGESGAAVGLFTAAIETAPPAATAGTTPLEQLVAVQEAERQRIARELHDWMGQDVTALSLGLKQLEASLVDAADRDLLSRLQSLTVQIGGHLHRIAWELRPTSLDDLGLVRALEAYAADWSERFGIRLDFYAACGDAERFPAAVETIAYRVVQAALTHVLKHVGMTNVSVVLETYESWLRIVIEDDGVEPAAGEGEPDLGIAAIGERLRSLGGTIAQDSANGVGSTLYIRIPLGSTNGETAGAS